MTMEDFDRETLLKRALVLLQQHVSYVQLTLLPVDGLRPDCLEVLESYLRESGEDLRDCAREVYLERRRRKVVG